MKHYRAANMLLEVLGVGLAAIFAFPVYILVTLSFKPQEAIAKTPLALPSSLDFSNYINAWQSANLGRAFLGSALITISSLVLLIAAGSSAAYFLARRQERLSYGLYVLFLFGIIVPFQLALIPLYQLMRDLHLLGTYFSVILFYLGLQLPFTVFLYTGFLRAVPRDYEESAMIDGASSWQAFLYIVFPLLRPITGTVIVINVVLVWNDFFTPLLYLSGTDKQTVPVAIYQFVGQYQAQWNLLFAGMVMASLPVLVVYFLLQRYIIQGYSSGLKG